MEKVVFGSISASGNDHASNLPRCALSSLRRLSRFITVVPSHGNTSSSQHVFDHTTILHLRSFHMHKLIVNITTNQIRYITHFQ